MKKTLAFALFAGLIFTTGCKKESTESPTATLDVDEKNTVLVAKHTWTGCGPCGGWGFNNFESNMQNHPNECHVAFTRGNLGGYDNTLIFDFFETTFNLPGATPTFHNNLNESLSISGARQAMDDFGVIANSNYEITNEGSKIKLKTTTKFFMDVEGKFLLAPYLVLDGIIADQSGHPDGANTEHHRVAIDIAKPLNVADSDYHGYKIAEGSIKKGYTVNLECEVAADPNWDPAKVSFALMIFRDNADGTYSLINTFTK